jgi:hypothetical protein
MIYYDFLNICRNNLKRKGQKHCHCSKITIHGNRLRNRSREVKCTILKVERDDLPGFGVEGEKMNFHKN